MYPTSGQTRPHSLCRFSTHKPCPDALLNQGGDISTQRQQLPFLSLGIILDQWGQFSSSAASSQDATNHPMGWTQIPSDIRVRLISVSEVLTAIRSRRGTEDLKSYLADPFGSCDFMETKHCFTFINFLSSCVYVLASHCTDRLALYPLPCYGTRAAPLWPLTKDWGRWRQSMNEWK